MHGMTQTAIMRSSSLHSFASEDAIKLLCHQRIRPCLQWHITEERTPRTAAGAGTIVSQLHTRPLSSAFF